MCTKPPGLGGQAACPPLPCRGASQRKHGGRPFRVPTVGRLQANGIQEADGSIPFSSTNFELKGE
jgi:hypothetical protein